MDAERATNRKNLAKSIDPSWNITQVLQRLIAHFDEYTDVFEGEELSLDMVRNWHQQEIAKARIDELKDIDAQRDHNMSYLGGRMSETDADNLATSRIKDRIAELSQTLKES